MTLGGLALAVGILVDDATVEIENTHRNIGMRKPLVRAVLDGASQIAVPTFVSTLSICIVFVPVLLLTGTAKYLFTPMAMAVVFAMLASYLLSRTLVPTMVHHLLRSEMSMYQLGVEGERAGGKGIFWSVHHWFNGLFERLRFRYIGLLDWSLRHRGRVLTALRRGFRGVARAGVSGGRGFLPHRRFRPDAPARARLRPARASKKPKCASPQIEREIRQRDSGRRNGHDHRQHRRPQ